jgi:hypothetical protein
VTGGEFRLDAPETAVKQQIPGAREAGMLTRFSERVSPARFVPEGTGLDAATTAERQREGGGAPRERGTT